MPHPVNPPPPSAHSIQSVVKHWLEKAVIGLNLCPFAHKVFKQRAIHYPVSPANDLQSALHELAQQLAYLDQHPDTETSLLIFSQGFAHFDDFNELIDYADQLLETLGYDGIYQIAHFHPHYCFADTDNNDPSNYTNRSPLPILHLLREERMAQALEKYPNPQSIPQTNIKLTRKLGSAKLRQLLDECFTEKK